MTMTKELWNKLVISKIVSKVGQNWKGTEKINLTEFYAGTRPKFVMAHCMLEHIDCRKLWTVRSKLDHKEFINSIKFSYENWVLFGVGLQNSYGAI